MILIYLRVLILKVYRVYLPNSTKLSNIKDLRRLTHFYWKLLQNQNSYLFMSINPPTNNTKDSPTTSHSRKTSSLWPQLWRNMYEHVVQSPSLHTTSSSFISRVDWMLNLFPLVKLMWPVYPISRHIASADRELNPSSQTVPPLLRRSPRTLDPTGLPLPSTKLNSENIKT